MIRFALFAAVACLGCLVLGFWALPGVHAAASRPLDSQAGASGWTESFDAAKAKAKTDKKLILADFTGSDWCPYCIQLKKEVLDTADFKNFAADRLVLLELDYPHKKQDEEVKKQNARLKNEFKIEGFPTVIVMDADGKEVGRIVGYSGAKDWSKELKKLVK